MIRKINETRRDDIIKARDEWDAEYNKQQSVYNDQKRNYNKVLYDAGNELEEEVKKAIGPTSINLRVEVRQYGNYNSDSYSVHVDGNDSNMFSDDVALSWNWDVYLDSDGTVKKDSGSWSGLKATTVEQLDDLEETLRVLKILNRLDWANLISRANSKRPDWNAYVTAPYPSRSNRPNFEQQLKDAAVEDTIGKDVLIQGKGSGKNYNSKATVWYYVVGATNKQYKVFEFSNYTIQNHEELGDLAEFIHDYAKYAPDHMTKEKFLSNIIYNVDTGEINTKIF